MTVISQSQNPAFEQILQRARQQAERIVLPVGSDRRIEQTAIAAAKNHLAHPILLGKHAELAASMGESAANRLAKIVYPALYEHLDSTIDSYVALRLHKGATRTIRYRVRRHG